MSVWWFISLIIKEKGTSGFLQLIYIFRKSRIEVTKSYMRSLVEIIRNAFRILVGKRTEMEGYIKTNINKTYCEVMN